ncbi:hypothetical protein ACF0H5_004682 [Mactra antiquata]
MNPFFVILMMEMIISISHGCNFPGRLQEDTWYTHIRADTRLAVNFRNDVIEYKAEETDSQFISGEWQSKCVQKIDDKFVVSYDNGTYQCVKFLYKSESIIQIRRSHLSSALDPSLCDASNLKLDPWLMVCFAKSSTEFTVCPISGGYNMKIKVKGTQDHSCNFYDVPMRFESECHTGEGISFDFRTPTCIGDLPMKQKQRALCVASWRQDGDVLTVLRTADTNSLWCLKIPARRTFDGKTIMYLYTDLICDEAPDVQYFLLELEMVSQNSLCTDEHKSCEMLPCNMFYYRCLKTCGVCDPNVYPDACDFPRRIRSEWIINDGLGETTLNITGSHLLYKRVGKFNCISLPDSPPSRKTKQFTTVSFFNNGCRPRYTCVSFKRIASNVFGFAIGQSKVWPLESHHKHLWSVVCGEESFHGDPAPLRDSYRTLSNVYKPMVSLDKPNVGQTCPLNASYIFRATFETGDKCEGSLFRDCENFSRLRMQFDNCQYLPQNFEDYICLGKVESKRWEKVILLQNEHNFRDTKCLVMSDLDRGRFLVLPSGECDVFTWTYVHAGYRTVSINLSVTPENYNCRLITSTSTTVAVTLATASTTEVTIAQSVQALNDAWRTINNSTQTINSNHVRTTHKHRHHGKDSLILPSTINFSQTAQSESAEENTPVYQFESNSNLSPSTCILSIFIFKTLLMNVLIYKVIL